MLTPAITRVIKTPKPGRGDAAHALTRAILGAVPIAGTAAAELFTAVIAPPLEKRRDQWMVEVGQILFDLQEAAGVDLDQLKTNDGFIDTVLEASQVALRTSQEEKRSALRSAIAKAALPMAPEQSLQQLFVRWIDEFTVWHLRMLDLFDDPNGWFSRTDRPAPDLYMGSLSALLESAYPDLRGRRSFYDLVWSDLYQRGLTNTDGLHAMMTGHGTLAKRTSELGAQFLSFIRAP